MFLENSNRIKTTRLSKKYKILIEIKTNIKNKTIITLKHTVQLSDHASGINWLWTGAKQTLQDAHRPPRDTETSSGRYRYEDKTLTLIPRSGLHSDAHWVVVTHRQGL